MKGIPPVPEGECALIEEIKCRFSSGGKGVLVGIGDDASLISPPGAPLLVTTDAMVEGVHFDLSIMTPFQVGYKLAVSNISDIHAMGGKPAWAQLALTVDGDRADWFADGFFSGLKDALDRYGVLLTGGDVTGSVGMISVSLTILGHAGERVFKRNGANPGDWIYLTGPLGESSIGLYLLQRLGLPVAFERGEGLELEEDAVWSEYLIRRFVLPELPDLPLEHGDRITSMIDISDGLSIDLWRICHQSGVGATLVEDDLPITPQMKKAVERTGIELLGHILGGGEDYQLLFTSSEDIPGFYRIGRINNDGFMILRKTGREEDLPLRGYQHLVSV